MFLCFFIDLLGTIIFEKHYLTENDRHKYIHQQSGDNYYKTLLIILKKRGNPVNLLHNLIGDKYEAFYDYITDNYQLSHSCKW